MPRIGRTSGEQLRIEDHGPEFLEVLARGLRVFEALGNDGRPRTLAEVAAVVDLPRATARRALHTLTGLGYVETDGRVFALTPKVLTLAGHYLGSGGVPTVMQPIVARVSAATGESCSAAVLTGDEVVFVARAVQPRILTVSLEIGYRLPAIATAVGRVLLGGLDASALEGWIARVDPPRLTDRTIRDKARLAAAVAAAREHGYCLVDEEVERGFRSLAVPVARRDGQIACAIHLGLYLDGSDAASALDRFLPILRAAAAEARPMLL